MLRALLLAAPGAGKGTQGERLAEIYGVPHLATGDLLRQHVAEGTPLGAEAQSYMDRGELVPDKIVNSLILNRLTGGKPLRGFILDGFPSSLKQAEDSYDWGQGRGLTFQRVISLAVDEDELVRRLVERGRRSGRSDDNEETSTVAIGFVLMAAGLALGATSDVGDSYGWTATWMSLVGLSIGFTLPPVMGAAMDALPAGRTGSGSAMIQALRQVGGTIGVAILGTVLNSAYRDRLDVHGLPPQVAEVARGSASAGVSVGSPEVADSARHAFVHGMDSALLTSAGVAVLALVLTLLFLPDRRTGTPPDAIEPERQTIGV